MKYTYPHTIENGHGEQLTFLRRINDASGDRLEVENKVQPGSGPPMHVHHFQDETITVVQGKIAAQVAGREPTFHGPGDTVSFKRGIVHRFWDAGNEELICKGWITPPDNIEYFLTEIYRSTKQSGNGRPSLYDGAFLQTKYKAEFDMTEIPGFVKKVIFPLVLLMGRIMGHDRRFKGAPEAVNDRL